MNRTNLISNLQNPFEFFCEMPLFEKQKIDAFLSFISKYNSSRSQKISIKFRTGGLTPESIPKTLPLAHAIHCLAKLLIPFKVTAGLHVPVPNFNAEVNAKMHGFLNVVLASMLAFETLPRGSHAEATADPLNIQWLRSKIFSKNMSYEHLDVQDNSITLRMPSDSNKKTVFDNSKIAEFRKKYFKGIGTCDFIEPIKYLEEHFS